MKFKLLKTTLLISLAAPSAVIMTSCNETAKSDTPVTPVDPKPSTPTQPDSTTKFKVRFKLRASQSDVTFTGPTIVQAKENAKFYTIQHPTAYKDGRPQTYWADEDGNEIKADKVITGDMDVYPYFQSEIQLKNCLSIIALEHTMLNIVHHGKNIENQPNIQYSTNGFEWYPFEGKRINILPGQALYLRGKNTSFNTSMNDYTSFSMAGTVHLNGSCMSLIDDGMGECDEIPEDYCFARLFEDCSGVKVISSDFLPAKKLKKHCYDSMFKNCTNLHSFPDFMLPATDLTGCDYCYGSMFVNCKSLTTLSPNLLKADKLAKACYYEMFRGCTGLTELVKGVLPSTNLAIGCYAIMFRDCTGITTIDPELLPATELQPNCYQCMFGNCTALTDLSGLKLPATSTVANCYKEMFYNCTALKKGPSLNAETVEDDCYNAMFYNCLVLEECPTMYANAEMVIGDGSYEYMFYNCVKLPTAPTLSSTAIGKRCYHAMFYNCTNLKPDTAISLPAETLQENCYCEMFYNCTSLDTTPTISATTLAYNCCNSMFSNCSALTSTPELLATEASESCYQRMFSNCTGLSTANCIGKIHLAQLANYACYMMFVGCSNIRITESSSEQQDEFFYCNEIGVYLEPVTSMFQGTKGTTGGYPARSGYHYTAGV